MTDTEQYPPALLITLEVAVPMHIVEMGRAGERERQRLAPICAQEIASHGDAIQFRSKKGATAKAFNALARALAIGSYQPGGIGFGGRHWCARPEQGCAAWPPELCATHWDRSTGAARITSHAPAAEPDDQLATRAIVTVELPPYPTDF